MSKSIEEILEWQDDKRNHHLSDLIGQFPTTNYLRIYL